MLTYANATVTAGAFWNTTCQRLFNQGYKTSMYHLTESFVMSAYVIGCVNCAASLPTVIFNLLLIIAIIKTTSLQTKTNTIIFGILVMNLLVGLFSLPTYGAYMIQTTMRISYCAGRTFTAIFGSSVAIASILLTVLLSFERYVALMKSYSYETLITKRKIICGIFFSWAIALMIILASNVKAISVYASVFMSCIILVGYTYNVVVHIMIFKVIQHMRRNQVSINVFNTAGNGSNDATLTLDGGLAAQIAHERKQKRTFKFTAYVIGFLLIFNLPTVVVHGAYRASPFMFMPFYAADTILCLHATFSPLLYAWQSPRLFRAVCRLFKRNATDVMSLENINNNDIYNKSNAPCGQRA